MNTELVIDVRAEEIVIALLKDRRLAELTTEKTSVKFAVGDIYYGRVKKIMPGLNAAFVNIGYEKDAFLHYLDLSPQFNSLNSYIKQCIARKGMPVSKLKLEPEINKNGKISDVLSVRADFHERPSSDLGIEPCRTSFGVDAFCGKGVCVAKNQIVGRAEAVEAVDRKYPSQKLRGHRADRGRGEECGIVRQRVDRVGRTFRDGVQALAGNRAA